MYMPYQDCIKWSGIEIMQIIVSFLQIKDLRVPSVNDEGAAATVARRLFKIIFFGDPVCGKLKVDSDALGGGKRNFKTIRTPGDANLQVFHASCITYTPMAVRNKDGPKSYTQMANQHTLVARIVPTNGHHAARLRGRPNDAVMAET
jgi:hypothetical protein